jgi:chaperonin GroES
MTVEELKKNYMTKEELEHGSIHWIVEHKLGLSMKHDCVLILEDKFKTGLECKTCEGSRTTNEDCLACEGLGVEKHIGTRCRVCDGLKKRLCPDCKGRGGLIIAPEESERRPSSGKVVSIGSKVDSVKLGERVFYSNYTGTAVNFKQKGVLRIMHQDEILGFLHGEDSIGDLVR